jgi:hypothetical protein
MITYDQLTNVYLLSSILLGQPSGSIKLPSHWHAQVTRNHSHWMITHWSNQPQQTCNKNIHFLFTAGILKLFFYFTGASNISFENFCTFINECNSKAYPCLCIGWFLLCVMCICHLFSTAIFEAPDDDRIVQNMLWTTDVKNNFKIQSKF